jgi:hypothetical protein
MIASGYAVELREKLLAGNSSLWWVEGVGFRLRRLNSVEPNSLQHPASTHVLKLDAHLRDVFGVLVSAGSVSHPETEHRGIL